MTAPEFAPLLAPLVAVQRLLERFDSRGVVIGGVAVSLLGAPRLTADIDVVLLLSVEQLPQLFGAARAVGLVPRMQNAEQFARQHRVALFRHEPSTIAVDVSLGILPFEEEAISRSVLRTVGDLQVRLPTPEDLIIMKAVAHRPKDLLDIELLVRSYPDLDRERVERWVREFATVLEMPSLWDDIAPIISHP